MQSINTSLPQAEKGIQAAADALRNGACVIFPTETVYGIAVRADDPTAVARIFTAKQRPQEKPLAYHIGSWDMFTRIAGEIDPALYAILSRYWPGPVSFLCDVKGVTQGFRFPSHPVAQQFLCACDVPVVATSANISGAPSPISADQTYALADYVAYIIDAGPTPLRGDSTIVDLTVSPPRCIRAGVIPEASLHLTPLLS